VFSATHSRIYDAESQSEIRQFPVAKILFCANGAPSSAQAACFAFTCVHGDDRNTAVFQCHVLRCHIPEAVSCLSSSASIELSSALFFPRLDVEAEFSRPGLSSVFQIIRLSSTPRTATYPGSV
jgi:hypothetical protein